MTIRQRCRPAAGLLLLIPVLSHAGIATAAGTPNSWSTAASLLSARSGLGAVTSPYDGRLYAVDGQSGGTYLGTVDAYTTASNSWASAPTDDPVHAGGVGVAATADGRIYAIGGGNPNPTNKAEYYTPATNKWSKLAGIPTTRSYLGLLQGSDGLLYAIGGMSGSTFYNTVEAYDPLANRWYCSTSVAGCKGTSTPPVAMPTARADFGITAANGLIYVIGGQTASGYTNVVEAYDPSTQTWICSTNDTASGCSANTLAPMPTARTTDAATDTSGLVYAIGGSNGSALDLVEAYNPSTNQWECSSDDSARLCTAAPLNPMPTARSRVGVALGNDGSLYALGGTNGSDLATVEAYTPPAVPGAPSGVAGTPGDSSVTVTWTAPASAGGTPVTSYTVSCLPACTAVTTSATSAVVTNLTNGVPYTFTVAATNFVGSGSASTASAPVTPAPSCSTSTSNLSVSGAAPGNFTARLNGSDQQVYTTLGSYTVANSTCSGWSLQFQATPFQSASGDQLPAGSLLMPAPTVSACQSACGSGTHSTPPSICIHNSSVALDNGSAVTVASAATNTGDGSYSFTPGTIGTGNLQLTVPSYAYATTYSSTLTITVAQGPATSC